MILVPLLAACLQAEPPAAPPAETCTSCHGDPDLGDPAPPIDLGRDTDNASVGVGAHQAHLHPQVVDDTDPDAPVLFSAPVSCDTCHHVPTEIDDPLHLDPPAAALPREDIPWRAEVTLTGAFAGTYDYDAHTCEVTCHGRSGAADPNPEWTQEGHPCGSCHGAPPPDPHPQNDKCSSSGCHPHAGSGPDHVNGTVDFQ